jgi:hypothetical protein
MRECRGEKKKRATNGRKQGTQGGIGLRKTRKLEQKRHREQNNPEAE